MTAMIESVRIWPPFDSNDNWLLFCTLCNWSCPAGDEETALTVARQHYQIEHSPRGNLVYVEPPDDLTIPQSVRDNGRSYAWAYGRLLAKVQMFFDDYDADRLGVSPAAANNERELRHIIGMTQ